MTIIGVSMASIKTEICSIIYLKWTIRKMAYAYTQNKAQEDEYTIFFWLNS